MVGRDLIREPIWKVRAIWQKLGDSVVPSVRTCSLHSHTIARHKAHHNSTGKLVDLFPTPSSALRG